MKNGHNNVLVNTADYTFNLVSMEKDADGAQRITMDLPVARDAVLRYEYVVCNIQSPARDYLVDLNVYHLKKYGAADGQPDDYRHRLGATGPIRMRKGFSEREYLTTIYYRAPGDRRPTTLGISDGEKQKTVSSSSQLGVTFKQQFFSSVMIAPENCLLR